MKTSANLKAFIYEVLDNDEEFRKEIINYIGTECSCNIFDAERICIINALIKTRGDVHKAVNLIGYFTSSLNTVNALRGKCRRLGINPKDYE